MKQYSIEKLSIKNYENQIYYGPVPSDQTYHNLKNIGVDIIWNLMEELPSIFEIEAKMYPGSINTPIEDFNVPDNEEDFLVDLERVKNYLVMGRKVFIHCLGGHGRTGMALASLIRKLEGVGPGEALIRSRAACRGPELEKQREFVRNLSL